MTDSTTSILWVRNDFRVGDNPALNEACERGHVLPVYIYVSADAKWSPGGATRVWLYHALRDFAGALERLNLPLIIRAGEELQELLSVAKAVGATRVVWNRRYEPEGISVDTRVKAELNSLGIEARSFGAGLLGEPYRVFNKQGKPFKVFTAFYKHCLQNETVRTPVPAPRTALAPKSLPTSVGLDALELLPTVRWDQGVIRHWEVGELAARKRLDSFEPQVGGYDDARDRPASDGVSSLSPYLHFGHVSAAQVVATVRAGASDAEPFVRQVYWRDFAHYLLFHFPTLPDAPMNAQFEHFPWSGDADESVVAWQRGQTGYPLIDAGMRQLWQTGWMHNRVRMNVASFLVKHLLTDWRVGAAWFWDTLFDADLANNAMGWQWAAGCGVDAAPYFRIFNPVLQGQRFDGAGAYIRRWVPELAALPDADIHAPWAASPLVLQAANVKLGQSYPEPVVDHSQARAAAQAAYAEMKARASTA